MFIFYKKHRSLAKPKSHITTISKKIFIHNCNQGGIIINLRTVSEN